MLNIEHYNDAVALQNQRASLVDFNTFLKVFETLPEPKYVQYFPHPEQVEELEEI